MKRLWEWLKVWLKPCADERGELSLRQKEQYLERCYRLKSPSDHEVR